MAEIRLVELSKRFGTVVAVDRVDLVVEDKEFLVLVGPSGCGKTTTLRMIAGLEEITEGQIYIGEKKVNDIPPKDRDIAMVFQNYALYPHMSVFKNLAFGLKQRKFPRSKIEHRVMEVAKLLGIEELISRKPKELSGGQRQRVAMGRAIVRKPQVFLFDEPLSNLDAKLRVQMRGELAKLHRRLETTIIYVTHDQIEAMTLADRIVVMDRGKAMQVGTPLDVYNDPQNIFVAGFIGSPSMNFLDVRLDSEQGRLCVQGENIKFVIPEQLRERFIKAKDRNLVLGIRPEHIFDKSIKEMFPGAETLEVTIDVVEPIGSHIILLVSSGSTHLTASVDPQTDAKPQMEKKLLVDMNRMHLFDKTTGVSY